MRFLFGLITFGATIGWIGPATAEDIFSVAEILPSGTFEVRPYVGAGVSYVHHTGYDRDRDANLEQWEPGGKLYAGIWYAKRAAAEVTYHYLNSSPLRTRNVEVGEETSNAVAASLLLFTPPLLSDWYPVRLFSRAGGTYKWITDDNWSGLVQNEHGLGFIIGGGAEITIGKFWFARIEYEYLSKINTSAAVNVQHTPISITVGFRQ